MSATTISIGVGIGTSSPATGYPNAGSYIGYWDSTIGVSTSGANVTAWAAVEGGLTLSPGGVPTRDTMTSTGKTAVHCGASADLSVASTNFAALDGDDTQLIIAIEYELVAYGVSTAARVYALTNAGGTQRAAILLDATNNGTSGVYRWDGTTQLNTPTVAHSLATRYVDVFCLGASGLGTRINNGAETSADLSGVGVLTAVNKLYINNEQGLSARQDMRCRRFAVRKPTTAALALAEARALSAYWLRT